MNIHWLGALSIIVFGFSVAIYYFLDGFLLTRVQLTETSKCTDFPSGKTFSVGSHDDGCWGPKPFSKAVIIVVDALRFDFMWSSATGRSSPSAAQNGSQYYLNQMPVFRDLAQREGWTTLFYEGVADAPTTTMMTALEKGLGPQQPSALVAVPKVFPAGKSVHLLVSVSCTRVRRNPSRKK